MNLKLRPGKMLDEVGKKERKASEKISLQREKH